MKFPSFETYFSASETSASLADCTFAPSKHNMAYMETAFIIAVALGVSVVLVILALVAVVIYQRWRISDCNVHLEKFITENMELRERLREIKE